MLPVRRGGHIVELGGGTGRNAERFGPRLARLDRYTLVELCAPMLAKARERAARLPVIRVAEADATSWRPETPADCAFFSYSLTMIPDWRAAIDNAIAMVRPGGIVASVDFYVGEAKAAPGMRQHAPWTRWFWPRWFGHDGVHLDPAHLAYLRSRLRTVALHERFGDVPWLPGLRVPHYLYVGRRGAGDAP
jgi:S-adenosylmethionine-diacylgycerolhomoserine-N-methlytransferase